MSKQFYFKLFLRKYSSHIKKCSISNNPVKRTKTDPIQGFQFSISTQFSSILPIDRALTGTISPSQNRGGRDGREGVLCIPQRSSITGTSPSGC